MVGIWLDNPNKPLAPNPFTVAGLIQGDPAYYLGNALLAVSTTFTIINTGTLASPTVVVNLSAGGSVTNQSNATITGIQAGVLITKSGSVTNQTGGLISAAMAGSDEGIDLEAAGSVFNAGNIQGQYAIVARSGSTVTNDTSGQVTGGANGIVVGQSGYIPPVNGGGTTGSVINKGTVTALGNDTYANGVVLNVDGVLNQNAAYVLNTGTLIGSEELASGVMIGLGIALNYGGAVKNSGLIQGGLAGISAGGNTPHKGPATIGNTGRIVGGQYGVRLFAGGLLRNAAGATIKADYVFTNGAVVFLKQGGVVQNYGTLTGGGSGVSVAGVGTVDNYGQILLGSLSTGGGITESMPGIVSNASSGTIFGNKFGVYMSGAASPQAGTIANAGLIQGITNAGISYISDGTGTVANSVTGTIKGRANGIQLGRGKTLNNQGTIAADPNYGGSHGALLNSQSSSTNAITGTISGGYSGVYIDTRGSIVNYGQITGSSDTGVGLIGRGPITDKTAGNLTNAAGGTISGTAFGVKFKFGTMSVTNAGTITGGKKAVQFIAGYTNQLQVAPGAVFTGKVDGGNTIGSSLASVLTLLPSAATAGTLAGFGPSIYNFATISFASGANWLLQGNQAGFAGGQTFSGFAAGDTIDIGGIITEAVRDYSGGTLTLGGDVAMKIIIPGAFTPNSFSVKDGQNTDTLITLFSCFATGTSIQTDAGERPVENLCPGMRVLTASGEAKEIIWVGHRQVDCRRHERPKDVYPVRVRAGAFGSGRPSRDLWLSPDHAVFIHDVLIPVRHLINGRTIRQEPVDSITWYHVELPTHDVILAENLAVESYLDSGDRVRFTGDCGTVARIWEMAACAQLVVTGPVLAKARRDLASRAKQDAGRLRLATIGSRPPEALVTHS